MSAATGPRRRAVRASLRSLAFTLIEVIVGLTIIAVLVAVAVPTVRGLQDERRARAPLRDLAELVIETRTRAMHERRPYQIVFEPGGFHAAPYLHEYHGREAFLEWLEDVQQPPENDRIRRQVVERAEIRRDGRFEGLFTEEEAARASGVPEEWRAPWVRSHPLGEAVTCELRFWGDYEWAEPGPGSLRRWVFQPTGMVTPLRVRFTGRQAFFEAGFDVLTGELVEERSSVTAGSSAGEGATSS